MHTIICSIMEYQAFKFVCSASVPLTPELTQQITQANAWVQLIPTGNNVPIRSASAFIPDYFTEIKDEIRLLRNEANAREEQIKKNIRKNRNKQIIYSLAILHR
jgi:hypothetical protein